MCLLFDCFAVTGLFVFDYISLRIVFGRLLMVRLYTSRFKRACWCSLYVFGCFLEVVGGALVGRCFVGLVV